MFCCFYALYSELLLHGQNKNLRNTTSGVVVWYTPCPYRATLHVQAHLKNLKTISVNRSLITLIMYNWVMCRRQREEELHSICSPTDILTVGMNLSSSNGKRKTLLQIFKFNEHVRNLFATPFFSYCMHITVSFWCIFKALLKD